MPSLLNRFNQVIVNKKLKMGKGAQIVATSAAGVETVVDMTELAALGGVTASAAELNILDGVTATTAQVNAATQAASAVRTITAIDSIVAADHNKTVLIDNATGFAITLPAPIAGFKVTIVSKTSNTSGNHTVVTATSANVIKGFAANAAGAAVTPLSDGDTISFVANQSVAGDQVSLTSDGTSWFMTGFAQVAAGITNTKAT
jgi:hypothetical protein